MKTAQDFIDFFSQIPEEKWCTKTYQDGSGRCCAQGHLGRRTFHMVIPSAVTLGVLFSTHGQSHVVEINDGTWWCEALGPTPKARILAALEKCR